jgi:glycosyltransferase involved in cell wall biosynthesis
MAAGCTCGERQKGLKALSMNRSEPELMLLIPENDTDSPEATILIPALNEELTIGEFIDWCHEGLKSSGVKGEILIVDGSSDKTAEIALSKGARVLKAPKRGLGRAYIDGLMFARGKYLILGDCDLTYDFRELAPFFQAMRNGAEFVMGSRFKGYIEPEAMPALHRYFGTPLTTWILNCIYKSSYSDIHCGMRGITKDAFLRLRMESQSWEYASEMVLKAMKLGLRVAEVPIRFYKDRAGRLSHHKRSGWFSPWQAGWINLKAMLLYSPDFFLLKPGVIFSLIGFLLSFVTAVWQPKIGPFAFNVHWMLLGVCLTLMGVSAIQMGVLGQVWHGFDKKLLKKYKKRFSYNRGMLAAAAQFFIGVALMIPAVYDYYQMGFRLEKIHYESLFGVLLLMTSFQTLGFTLLFTLILDKFGREEKTES